MKKIALLCLVLLLALSACNLPADEQTPSQDAIATRVSIQLTSLPTATLQPTVEPSATPEATATLEPTATTTVTNTPEATATTATNDIRATLGEPTWKETFTSGKSFGLDNEGYDDDQTSIRIENEALVLVSKTASGYHGWRTGGPSSSDRAYVEATFTIGNCNGSDTYGLVLRSPDYINGHWFAVTCAGDYWFGYWKDTGYVELVSGTNANNAIKTGSNQTNRLGVKAEGDRFGLYANGVLLQEVTDSTFKEGGHQGAMIAGAQTANFTVRMEEIAYWNLP